MGTNKFVNRHVGISAGGVPAMLETIGVKSLDELIDQTIPTSIRLKEPLNLPEAMTEREFAEHIIGLASKSEVFTSYIGMDWYDTVCPAPIQRNVFKNPVWYTSYMPYQAGVSQGHLEASLNFQTVIYGLTRLPLTNCSLLNETTAIAEAVTMFRGSCSRARVRAEASTVFVDENVFVSILVVIHTHVIPQGIQVVTGDYKKFEFTPDVFAAIVQFPNADGLIGDYKKFIARTGTAGTKVGVTANLMSLILLTPPREWGADVVFGSSQRFDIPMFYGGPSVAFFATKDDYKHTVPGRIVGIPEDAYSRPAYRLALQTREQHIRCEKAASGICTIQALLATMTGFYTVYRGMEGLRNITGRIHSTAGFLTKELEKLGCAQLDKDYFDTLKIQLPAHVSVNALRETASECKVSLRYFEAGQVGVSIDGTALPMDIDVLLCIFAGAAGKDYMLDESAPTQTYFNAKFARTSDFLQQNVFKKYHTETELMRCITRLRRKDVSLTQPMISLGSYTMKLNPTSTMLPLSRAEFINIHPYTPEEQVEGYTELIENLSSYLCAITGFEGCTLQPNSGAAGKYTGPRVIRAYQKSISRGHRDIILLPASTHETSPASAIQYGYKTATIRCDENGSIDLEDFRAKAGENKERLAANTIIYPSTHDTFEVDIKEMCDIAHAYGGQLYVNGANMNTQVGLTNPSTIGADICHLNLHKTFSSPHGGGGPDVGPIYVAEHLVPLLPQHPVLWGSDLNTVFATPYGSADILPITYVYIRLLGTEGLETVTKTAILSANYLAAKFKDTYSIAYTGATGRIGRELILECRTVKGRSSIDEGDIAKRLMDFGYHAPTLSFPIYSTLMVEPTESESETGLGHFVEVVECVWNEIKGVEEGKTSREDSALKNAPHPEYEVTADEWEHAHPRAKAAFPLEWLHDSKFWISVTRIGGAYGDRDLIPTLYTYEI